MRIHGAIITGFGPFRDRQVVDLDRFARDGLFLISGRTGAGKSSILDAVCFAIYGGTPRFDGTQKRFRSDHARPGDPTTVVVELSVGDNRWRVERSPSYERPKARGEGTTTAPATSRMGLVPRDAWDLPMDDPGREDATEWRAAKDREVAALVAEEIGLTQQQFLQVVLLAQGRFARFLLADNSERQGLLRTLFDSRRFEDYRDRLAARRQAADDDARESLAEFDALVVQSRDIARRAHDRQSVDDGGGQDAAGSNADDDDASSESDRAGSDESVDARLSRIVAELAAVDARARGAEADVTRVVGARDLVAEERDRRRQVAERQQRRDTLIDREKSLTERAPAMVELAALVRLARAAAPIRVAIAAAARARTAAEAAADRRDDAAQRWSDTFGDEEESERRAADDAADAAATGTALREIVAARQRRLGELESALTAEREDESAAQQVTELEQRAARAAATLAVVERELRDLPALREALVRDRDVALAAAGGIEQHRTELERTDAHLAAVHDLAQCVERYRAATAAATAAREARTRAEHTLDLLHQRRLGGYAAELAGALTLGLACPVCGATEHPRPAAPDADPVTPEQIARAEDERAARVADDDRAADARRGAEQELAAAETRTGGRTEAELTDDRARMQSLVRDAERAAGEADRLDGERAALEEREAHLSAQRQEANGVVAEVTSQLASRRDALDVSRRAIAQARGEHATVADRVAREEDVLQAAQLLVDARETWERATAESARAHRDLDDVASNAGFKTAGDAERALRDDGWIDDSEATLRDHESATRAVADELAPLRSVDLPTEPVDLAEVQQRWEAANADVDHAVAIRADLRQAAAALRDVHQRAAEVATRVGARLERAAAVGHLARTVSGQNQRRMDLETFVLAAELEEIVAAANRRLDDMSQGRYRLEHTDDVAYRNAASGLGLRIVDAFTGAARSPRSLSGGETFLASLALALGLAEVVTQRSGGMRLDTLFIDEGFGSLDSETLDVAMRTLDALREGGRTVGVISHVESMKEQIPGQLVVTRASGGWSIVE